MTIEKIPTDKLIPYARNAKKHDAAQVSKLAGSIREFGFNNPVLIDSKNGIIAGHGRVMAAQQLGLADVPCIRLGHLTDNQRKAYILADNRLAEIGGGWDQEMLGLQLAELREADFNLDLVGFNNDEIEAALNPPEIVFDVTDEWKQADMPEYDGTPKGEGGTIIVHFATSQSRLEFSNALNLKISDDAKFCWYPSRPQ